jgi:hypothetical protein
MQERLAADNVVIATPPRCRCNENVIRPPDVPAWIHPRRAAELASEMNGRMESAGRPSSAAEENHSTKR